MKLTIISRDKTIRRIEQQTCKQIIPLQYPKKIQILFIKGIMPLPCCIWFMPEPDSAYPTILSGDRIYILYKILLPAKFLLKVRWSSPTSLHTRNTIISS